MIPLDLFCKPFLRRIIHSPRDVNKKKKKTVPWKVRCIIKIAYKIRNVWKLRNPKAREKNNNFGQESSISHNT